MHYTVYTLAECRVFFTSSEGDLYFKSHIALLAVFALHILYIFFSSTVLHAIIYILRVFGAQKDVVVGNTLNIFQWVSNILYTYMQYLTKRQPF